jgi:hypothetical protein
MSAWILGLLLLTAPVRALVLSNLPGAFMGSHPTIRFCARVLPSENNRLVRVELESDTYYRSSDIALEGADAPLANWLEWRSLPDGHYRLLAFLYVVGNHEAARAAHTFQVGAP